MHYLDNAATTQVAPQVVQIIQQTLTQHFANPSSLYAPGFEAEQVITKARGEVAKAMGCRPAEIVFTGSGTEGNNIAVLGLARARSNWGNHLVATGYEHPAVSATLEILAKQEGFSLTLVAPGPDGTVPHEALAEAVGPKTVLVCAMQVNNETGAVIDAGAVAKAVKAKNPRTAVHVDGVQGFCKLPPALKGSQIDSYAVAGHKLHAPKGVGALYLRQGVHILPPLAGGGQEKGLRPGTENTAYIAGFSQAVQLAAEDMPRQAGRVRQLQSQLLQGLGALAGVQINSPQNAYPGIVNFSIPGLRSEPMLHFLEERQVYVSSGSACAKGAQSHTLAAMKLPAARINSALRVSFDSYNTPEDIDALLAGLRAGMESLARA